MDKSATFLHKGYSQIPVLPSLPKMTAKLLILALTVLFGFSQAFATTRNATYGSARDRRSGGYPKFPVLPMLDEPPLTAPLMCGSRSVEHRPMLPTYKIVGGTVPPYGSYPWQVGIQKYKEQEGAYEHHCGGALISPSLVLTAAHCLDTPERLRLRVVLGDYSLQFHDSHQHSFKVQKIVIHPDFRKSGPYSNDIALLKLKGAIMPNSFVQSICLPAPTDHTMVGDWCTVTGWGANVPDYPDTVSAELRAAAVPVLSLDTCRSSEIYGGRRQPILDSMLCAGRLNGGVDACAGDSGGPLACKRNGRFYLEGIVSWGDGCAKKNRPGVYTRVSHYDAWIHEAIRKLSA